MPKFDYDLITIGAGSGGVRASRLAGAYGARVAIIEELREGGTCVLRGCVPKKLLVYGSHVAEELSDAEGYGWKFDGTNHNWARMIEAKKMVFMGTSFSVNITAIALRIAASNSIDIEIIDPNPIDIGYKHATYFEMSALEYVESFL